MTAVLAPPPAPSPLRSLLSAVARALPLFLAAFFAALWLLPVSVAWQLAPDLGHAWAVPALMAYLWWERWAERPSSAGFQPAPRTKAGWKPALLFFVLLLAAFELFLRLFLTPFPLWPALLLVYTLLYAGVTLSVAWLLAGRAGVRWIGGPLLLLISSLPIPSLAETAIIIPLRTVMATLAAEISNLVGYPALALGTSVRLGGGWVGIDEACGGIRSLQACVMIGLFFGEWYRFRWTRRAVLLTAAIGAALLGNFARVLILSLLANAGPGAIERAHDPAGWLAMAFSLVLTGWLACRWAGYRWPKRQLFVSSSCERKRVALHAAPSLATLVLLFALNETATRVWFAHGENQHTLVPRWTAAFPENDPTFQRQPLGETAREMLKPDYFNSGRWRAAPDLYAAAYYVEWHRGQLARSIPFLHNPTVCLPVAGCELVETLPPIIATTDAGEIPFYAYKFRQTGHEILVVFTIWDTARNHSLRKPEEFGSWRDWWRAQWAEVSEARQHQPAQLLSVTLPSPEATPIAVQKVLQRLIRPL